jgi:hypothetical protein
MRAVEPLLFIFHLPPVLMRGVPIGVWPRAPRGCRLEVEACGTVTVASVDALESYATEQVFKTTGAFLREAIMSAAPPTSLPACLTPRAGRGAPIAYAISLGARVSIARTAFEPIVIGGKEKSQLTVVE